MILRGCPNCGLGLARKDQDLLACFRCSEQYWVDDLPDTDLDITAVGLHVRNSIHDDICEAIVPTVNEVNVQGTWARGEAEWGKSDLDLVVESEGSFDEEFVTGNIRDFDCFGKSRARYYTRVYADKLVPLLSEKD